MGTKEQEMHAESAEPHQWGAVQGILIHFVNKCTERVTHVCVLCLKLLDSVMVRYSAISLWKYEHMFWIDRRAPPVPLRDPARRDWEIHWQLRPTCDLSAAFSFCLKEMLRDTIDNALQPAAPLKSLLHPAGGCVVHRDSGAASEGFRAKIIVWALIGGHLLSEVQQKLLGRLVVYWSLSLQDWKELQLNILLLLLLLRTELHCSTQCWRLFSANTGGWGGYHCGCLSTEKNET